MSRKTTPIEASPEDLKKLQVMSRSQKIQSRYATRAKVILLSLEGKTMDAIIAQTGLSRPNVNKWRQRFRSKGMEGLKDAPRSGKPPVITAEQKDRVIQKACEKPPHGPVRWPQKHIAAQTGMSQSKVHQILQQAGLKPPKIAYWYGNSPDTETE